MTNDKEQFPHFISTNPTGEDLLDGRSQIKICSAITEHILSLDKGEEDINMPRVIGLEGTWGSGKSNVLYHLEHEDFKEHKEYVFFLYDAWANQEDLQRRSILELLTNDLLYCHEEPLLKGTTKVKVQAIDKKQPKGYKTVEEKVEWPEKLDMLMAKRVKNINKTVSPLNTEFKLFMLDLALTPIFLTLMNCLKFDGVAGWWYFSVSLLVALLPTLVIALIFKFNKNKYSFKRAFQAYQSHNEEKTTHQIINEAEPTIREFTSWMSEVSESLGSQKLIVVFDNMDRLPAEKVKQLWSSIHSLFSSAEYPNIWCVIPYDFTHLMNAFGGDEEITKYFIQKSFPVTYRVPEPAIIDYKNLFNKFFIKAFGKTVPQKEIGQINDLYRSVRQKPNVREVITFINRIVELKKQWGDELNNISLAIFLLREDDILRHPAIISTSSSNPNGERKKVSTDAYILSNDILKGLSISNINREKLYTELSALVYGIEPKDAYQVVMQNSLRDCFKPDENKATINNYVQRRHFGSVLQEVVNSLSPLLNLNNFRVIDSINLEMVEDESKPFIQSIWNKFAESYCRIRYKETEFGEFDIILLKHIDKDTQERVIINFVRNIIANKEINGSQTFEALSDAYKHDGAKNIKPEILFDKKEIEAKRFLEFVESSMLDYKTYGLFANNKLVCEELSKSIGADFKYFDSVEILSKDENYDLSDFVSLVKSKLQDNKAKLADAYSYIKTLRKIEPLFDGIVNKPYVSALWAEAQSYDDESAKEEIYTLFVSFFPETNMEVPSFPVEQFAGLSSFYNSTAEHLENFISYPTNPALSSLITHLFLTKTHDGNPISTSVIEHLDIIKNNLPELKNEDVILFFDSWGIKSLTDSDRSQKINQLLPTVSWLDTFLSTKTELGNSIIAKAVIDLEEQPRSQFYDVNLNSVNTYWSQALKKLAPTDLLSSPLASPIHEICYDIIKRVAQNQQVTDATLLALFKKITFEEFNSELRELCKNVLNHVSGYSISSYNFKLLHLWLERLGINNPENLGDCADYIIAPIVDDPECQTILLTNKDYYSPIITGSLSTSSNLSNKLKELKDVESEFGEYLRSVFPMLEADDENKK